ncbi:telomere repeats-binding bouquet formation protein 2, partial [Varanus komodoensis]|uniref:telomere repeats-binding bouquet formation protein 2 n=1 Tax=Varanus komodoensis TaxID=61221 RepID=UPI001CF7B29A
MFGGHRAWFSQSVGPEPRRLWVTEGGVITNQDGADYLFSSDASHPDTKRIHQSIDYLEDRMAVFHAYYLTASANSEIKNTVPIGHFLLPPACLQREIREKIGSFVWEQIPEPLKLQPRQPVERKRSREGEDRKGARGSERREISQAPGTLEIGKLAYIPLQNYPASNMVTGYPSAKEMKKFVGKIQDFIPGCSGCLAYWISNEKNIFSDRKTK